MINKKVETFRDLVVWQKSHELIQQVYLKTSKFPKKELTLLVPQIRNAAVQVPINIAIGFNKRSKKAKVHYYRTALNAIEEVQYYILLAADLGMYKEVEIAVSDFMTIEKMLKRLIRSNIAPRE
jgi:four helix bundle protein